MSHLFHTTVVDQRNREECNMGRLLGPTCKPCRRDGVSVCGRENCALKRRNTPPGVHGPKGRGRISGYGIQLREKQKAKHLYGILEKQFRRYYGEATRRKGDTGLILVQLLEERLDNVVYRLGYAKTRRQSRQMVSHGLFTVNGKNVNIPSYSVKIGDEVAIKENKKDKKIFSEATEAITNASIPSWLKMDIQTMTAKVLSHPEGDELKQVFDPTLIIEFYSR